MTLEGNYFISLSPVSNYSGPSCWYRRWDPLALSTVQPNPFGLYNPSPKFNPPSLVLSPRGSNPAAAAAETGLSIWELVILPTSATLQDPFSAGRLPVYLSRAQTVLSAAVHWVDPAKRGAPSEIVQGLQGPQNNAVSSSAAGTVSLASTAVAGSWSVHSFLACGNQVWFLLGRYYYYSSPLPPIEPRIPSVVV